MARIVSELIAKSVQCELVSEKAQRASLRTGDCGVYANLLLSLYTGSQAGEFEMLEPTLERLMSVTDADGYASPESCRSILLVLAFPSVGIP